MKFDGYSLPCLKNRSFQDRSRYLPNNKECNWVSHDYHKAGRSVRSKDEKLHLNVTSIYNLFKVHKPARISSLVKRILLWLDPYCWHYKVEGQINKKVLRSWVIAWNNSEEHIHFLRFSFRQAGLVQLFLVLMVLQIVHLGIIHNFPFHIRCRQLSVLHCPLFCFCYIYTAAEQPMEQPGRQCPSFHILGLLMSRLRIASTSTFQLSRSLHRLRRFSCGMVHSLKYTRTCLICWKEALVLQCTHCFRMGL